MEQKLQNRYGRWGRALCFALALALAALLSLTALPLTGVYADDDAPSMPRTPLNWDQKATLQLKLPEDLVTDEDDREFLEKNLVVDLYLLAKAVPVDGYDIYAFELNTDLPASVKTGVNDFLAEHKDVWPQAADGSFRYTPKRTPGMSADEMFILDDGSMAELSKMAAERIFNEADAIEPFASAPFNQAQAVPFGLYVAVPHTADMTKAQYQVKVPVKGQTDKYNPAALAVAPYHVYTFSPQLISVPSLGGLVTDTAANAYTEWDYTVEAMAKPEDQPRYASLELTKAIDEFNGPAAFVFQITATQDQEIVLEKEVGLQIDRAGDTPSVKIDCCIPVDSELTIEEIYTGTTYTLSGYGSALYYTGTTNLSAGGPWGIPIARPNGNQITFSNLTGGSVKVIPWNSTTNEEELIEIGDTLVVTATNTADNETGLTGGGVVNKFDQSGTGTDSWHGWTVNQHYVGTVTPDTQQ